MFGKKDHRKKGGVSGIFRLFLSLIILALLGVGLLQAVRHFSGTNPLSVSPIQIFKNLFSSQSAYEFVTGLLSASPEKSIQKAKELLSDKPPDQNSSKDNVSNIPTGAIKYKFAVLADSHLDTLNLKKALTQAKNSGAVFVIGMGDFSDVGTEAELQNTKTQFESAQLPFYLTPGDHDLWDSRNRNLPPDNTFRNVFGGIPYQSFTYQGSRFIILYNTDNYNGLDELQLKWVEDELNKIDELGTKPNFVFADTPLYHPSSDHIMGKSNPKLKNQADHLMAIFKKHGISEVFSADTHFYSRFSSIPDDLKMTTVGAVTSVRNPQTPRFVMVDVYEDGGYNIQTTEIR